MALIDPRQNSPMQNFPEAGLISRNTVGMQNTEFESDKLDFNDYQLVRNMVFNKKNVSVRRGSRVLVREKRYTRIFYVPTDNGNILVGAKRNSGNTDLVQIDRDTGDETVLISGVTGEGVASFAYIRNKMYFCNGLATDIQVYDFISSTASTISVGGVPKLLAGNGERIWYFTVNGIFGFSSVNATTFTPSGTNIDRAGIAATYITDATALKGLGKLMFLADKNNVEVYKTPGLEYESSVFPVDLPLRMHTYENIGVESQGAMLPVAGRMFIKPPSGVLYFVYPGDERPRDIRKNLGQMERIQWDKCELGYEFKENRLLISGRITGAFNNITVAYDYQTETFSFFDGFSADCWAQDGDTTYFVSAVDGTIYEAFPDDTYTDDKVPIQWSIVSSASYAGDLYNNKIAQRVYLNVNTYQDINVYAKFYVDRRIRGTKGPSWQYTYELKANTNTMFEQNAYFGDSGAWDMLAFDLEAERSVEYYSQGVFINEPFMRGVLEINGESSRPFDVRGLGITYSNTTNRRDEIVMPK